MNTNDHIDPQLQQLLDSLSTHAKNQRRQAALADQIDQLAAQESKRRRWPWWTAAAAVAALLVAIVLNIPDPQVQMEPQNRLTARVEPKPAMTTLDSSPSCSPQTSSKARLMASPVKEETSEAIVVADTAAVPTDTPTFSISSPAPAAEPLLAEVVSEEPCSADEPANTQPNIVIESNSLIAYNKGPIRRSHRKTESSVPRKDLFGNPVDPCGGALLAMEF